MVEAEPLIVPAAVRAVLFDAVGTVLRCDPPVADVYHQAGLAHGSQLPRHLVAARFQTALARHLPPHADADQGRTSQQLEFERWQRIVQEVFHDLDDTAALFARLWRHFAEPRHWRLYDDVADCWRRLAAGGLVLGLASNFDDRLDDICRHLPPVHRGRQFISSQIGWRKPAQPFFRAIEQALGLKPHELLLVGDDLDADYHAARQAGWHAVWLCRGTAPAATPNVAAPHLTYVNSLDEIGAASRG